MDHRYDLEEMNKTAHEYKAHITPVQCKRYFPNISNKIERI